MILYVIDLENSSSKSIQSELDSNFLKNKNIIIVGNKNDLKIKKEVNEYFINNSLIQISAQKNEDIINLKNSLNSFIKENLVNSDSSIMINERHFAALNNVNKSIFNVKKNLKNKSNTDLLALDIKYALTHLGEITGEISNDEVLGNIFSKFCIGK